MKLLSILLACVTATAQAHVTLEQPQATADSSYKAVLRVTHGCEGTATHTVRVSIPAGFRGAKPRPKPGWTIDLRREKLAQPYDSHGRTVTDDVVEVTWVAASRDAWLVNAWFDEFVLLGQTPEQPGVLWFKVRQLCERGEWNWADVPAEGTSTRDLKAPAAPLQVVPAAAADNHAHH
jgi:uncharacterized protein YcnI